MAEFRYIGSELDLFARATKWKSYLRSQIAPHLGDDVLEVGAGIGATTRALCEGRQRSWVCLEPDPGLVEVLRAEAAAGRLPACCRPETGTTVALPPGPTFDTIIYIDVLEHIEDDAGEMRRAAGLLRPGGKIVVLCPAHQSLYTAFDRAIGHFRRYNRRMLAAAAPPGLVKIRLCYLDSVGLIASAANKVLLRQGMPTRRQIHVWDSVMVALSRLVDPVIAYQAGKSVLGIWKAPAR